jgi:hypothetical protein
MAPKAMIHRKYNSVIRMSPTEKLQTVLHNHEESPLLLEAIRRRWTDPIPRANYLEQGYPGLHFAINPGGSLGHVRWNGKRFSGEYWDSDQAIVPRAPRTGNRKVTHNMDAVKPNSRNLSTFSTVLALLLRIDYCDNAVSCQKKLSVLMVAISVEKYCQFSHLVSEWFARGKP